MDFIGIIMGLGLLFYILLGFRDRVPLCAFVSGWWALGSLGYVVVSNWEHGTLLAIFMTPSGFLTVSFLFHS